VSWKATLYDLGDVRIADWIYGVMSLARRFRLSHALESLK
jgi:hypothetical protein